MEEEAPLRFVGGCRGRHSSLSEQSDESTAAQPLAVDLPCPRGSPVLPLREGVWEEPGLCGPYDVPIRVPLQESVLLESKDHY